MAIIAPAKFRTELHKSLEKTMAPKTKNTDPRPGKLYRMGGDDGQRHLWTGEHGWLWVYTGKDEHDALRMQHPIFKSVATGHEEWLPWDWMEEVKDGAA